MKEKITIVKMGGKVVDDPALFNVALKAFSEMSGPRILVHGGGNIASSFMKRVGIEPVMINGRRVTDDASLEIVIMTYAGLINKKIVAALQALDTNAVGLSGADMDVVRAIKRPVADIDYGWAGDVTSVNAQALFTLLEVNAVPVLCPLTHDGNGQLLNTNADTMAAEVAQALSSTHEVHLIYTFELPGVMRDLAAGEVIPHLNQSRFRESVADGTISGGMVPKLENALKSVEKGVSSVVICGHGALAHWGTESFTGTIVSR